MPYMSGDLGLCKISKWSLGVGCCLKMPVFALCMYCVCVCVCLCLFCVFVSLLLCVRSLFCVCGGGVVVIEVMRLVLMRLCAA